VVTIEGEDHLRADPDLLSAVLANLLDNSARHSATNVLITSYTADQQHHLTVVDNGKGCPPQEVQRLRLSLAQQRYTSDAGSNGLGLVLADIVLRAHLGGVRLPDTPSGFVVELYWPTHHG
jgi:K+-sensing histidine kinase KdpD